jgi:hypothetical protein
MIAIPSSIKQIQNSASKGCECLRSLTFDFPSGCWHFASGAFQDCTPLESIFLPPSVEVIDPTVSLSLFIKSNITQYHARNSFQFCETNGLTSFPLVAQSMWTLSRSNVAFFRHFMCRPRPDQFLRHNLRDGHQFLVWSNPFLFFSVPSVCSCHFHCVRGVCD